MIVGLALSAVAAGRQGSELNSIRPAPQARPGRSAVPVRPIARRAPLSPDHLSGRANSSVAPEPAHSRSASTSGGLSSRRRIVATVVGGRSLSSLLREPASDTAQHLTDGRPGLLWFRGLHGRNHGGTRWKNLSGELSEKFGARA